MDFSTVRGVIMDMDGVLWTGDQPLPGMHDCFAHLRARGLPFALATNNSSKAPTDYAAKLARLDVADVPPEAIVTSGTAAISYLTVHYPPSAPIHVLGGDGLRHLVTSAGFTLADVDAAAVVVGLDPHLTYERLKRAALLIRAGAAFIATNTDATFPMPEGLAPGAGSLVAALRTATDCEPVVMGKPHAPMFEAALRYLDCPPNAVLMIGDRLDTDIAGAKVLGLRTALVLTGVGTAEAAAASSAPPDAVYSGLPALLDAWTAVG